MSLILSLEVRDGCCRHRNCGGVGHGGTVIGGGSVGGREVHAERLLANDPDVLAP